MLRKLREARDEEGFTLIELLVVVLIIGILAAIAIPVFLNQREKAFRDAVSSDLRNAAIVMEDYYSDNVGVYPSDIAAEGFQPSDGVTINVFHNGTNGVDGYCFEGYHTAFGGTAAPTENWMYDTQNSVATASVQHSDTAALDCTTNGATQVGTVSG